MLHADEAPAPPAHSGLAAFKPVTLAPLATVDERARFDREVLAALPHLAEEGAWKVWHYCPADANRDDRIDAADIAFFLDAWSRGDSFIGRLGDANRDAKLDERDYPAFMDAYFGGDCSPEETREHRLRVC
ncbi:MAG TPA: hypothetical protein VFF65_11895 [Phycisphaerales bacterium]|nr:hypothetical protein [Phycisphaerales bacterium]